MASLSQNVTQAISDLASIKAAIEDKGVTIPANTPSSDYADLIDDIPSGDDSTIIGFIEMTLTHIDIPQGTTKIGDYAFIFLRTLRSVTIPNTVTSIGKEAFRYCALTSITIPNITIIKSHTFADNPITSVIIPNSVTTIEYSAFDSCKSLTDLTIPNSVTSLVGSNVFPGCSKLMNVTIENGFNANYLNLSASTRYTAATIVSWLNALADRTGQTAYTLTIGTTNLNKLTAEQIAIATNKNWNLT